MTKTTTSPTPEVRSGGSATSAPTTVSAPAGSRSRTRVRMVGSVLTAAPVATPGQIIRTLDGLLVQGHEGDWVLTTADGQILRVVSAAVLEQGYEPVEDAALAIPGMIVRQLEDRLGPGACRTPESLLAAVRRLAQIGVGEVEIAFSPGQLEEIAHRARRNNRTVEQELQWIVRRLEDDLFHGGTPRGIVGRI